MATTIVRPRVFLDLMNGTDPVGRVVLELFSDKAPKTCEKYAIFFFGTPTFLVRGLFQSLAYASSSSTD